MTLPPYQRGLLVLVLVGQLLWPAQAAIAVPPKHSKETKLIVSPAPITGKEARHKTAPSTGRRPGKKPNREQPAIADSVNRKASDPTRARKVQSKKARKTLRPLASVQPKPDLSYHGMLEQPARYDPGRASRKGAAPNPQAGDLLYDHFQELDKNRDGMIDPFERALGRLDIDRDLTNRQWK